MNLKQTASDIVLKMQDERWQAQEARILAALEEAYRSGDVYQEAYQEGYRLGFVDGEAAESARWGDPDIETVEPVAI